MKLDLDTNVFNNRQFCDWLFLQDKEKYLPAVAYMEYLYHHLKKGNTESMVDAFLEHMNIVVPFGKDEAVQAALGSFGNWDFGDNAREYTIGATAIKLNVTLVTNNIKHFKWMENVTTPEDILKNTEL